MHARQQARSLGRQLFAVFGQRCAMSSATRQLSALASATEALPDVLPARQQHICSLRAFASSPATEATPQAKLDEINDMFAEAREELEMAREDKESTYFDESFDEAKRLVDATLGLFKALIDASPEDEKRKLMRSMGMKMEQLRAGESCHYTIPVHMLLKTSTQS